MENEVRALNAQVEGQPAGEGEDQSPTEWFVLIETRDPSGCSYNNVYSYVPGIDSAAAIDYALERYAGFTGGQFRLIDGRRLHTAGAVPQRLMVHYELNAISIPVYERGKVILRKWRVW